MPQPQNNETEKIHLKSGVRYRTATLSVREGEGGKKTYSFNFSSENPVKDRLMWVDEQERFVYGTEILSHKKESIDLSFIGSGRAPFLVDHRWDKQAAVILGVTLDEENGRLRVDDLKFSRKPMAQELQGDIDDEIRKNVSVGYVIEEVRELEPPKKDTPGVYLVTKWKPYEVSSVSIPADEGVGFRDGRNGEKFSMTVIRSKQTNNNKTEEGRNMPVPEHQNSGANPVPEETSERLIEITERDSVRGQISKVAELNRELFPKGLEMATKAIATDQSFEDFYKDYEAELLRESERQANAKIDIPAGEKREYSIMNIVRALDVTNEERHRIDIGFEREVNQEYSKQRGITPGHGGLLVPYDVIAPRGKRAAIISGTTGAGVVEEFHSGEVFAVLREESVVFQAGARRIAGLVGKYDMGIVATGTTAYDVGEKDTDDDDVADSAFDIDLLSFTIKTMGVSQPITRQMQKQTSLDVENIVREDIFANLGDGIDLRMLVGTGASNQSQGICYKSGVGTEELGGADAPTFADYVNMETAVANAKALRGSLAYICHPTHVGHAKQTPIDSGSGIMIAKDGEINGYRYFSTTNALRNSVKTSIFGNFRHAMVGLWGGMELTVDPYSMAKKGIVNLVCYQDYDTQVARAASFVYSTNPI